MNFFVRDVDYKVGLLPQNQAAIIRKLYMGKDPLPTDQEVYNDLYDEKWYVSERHYYEQKAEAMMTLAYAFRIEQYAG
ncbi:hypothetical protein GCM10025859_63060 [Alicyclobacillus fastidiosus]|nr:hypothetical protein GCM10025859_62330 [Alicyclobacillus fastidiosus]GMA65865.1 hypothetical protein GCM10025859_63060 [Alicyclobacillus fastidiosus]